MVVGIWGVRNCVKDCGETVVDSEELLGAAVQLAIVSAAVGQKNVQSAKSGKFYEQGRTTARPESN